MVEMSEPGHLTDMAVEIGIERGDWGNGKSSVFLIIDSKHCNKGGVAHGGLYTMMLDICLLYTSPSPRDRSLSRMPSSA